MTKTYIDELAEEIATLKEKNNKLNEMCNYWSIEETERTMECYKLKQLLKECREVLNKTAYTYKFDIVAKIDEVLRWKYTLQQTSIELV